MKIFSALNRLYAKLILKFAKSNSIYYINGPEKLPPPLSAEEESDILKNYDGTSQEVKDILVTHNLRLVVYIAKKFDTHSSNIEDLISIGTIGLIKAVNTFRPDKNIKLATYASRCIENEILMYLRKFSGLKNEISIDEPLNVDWDGNELLLSDVLGSDPNEISSLIESEAEKEMLNKLVFDLCEREQVIMKLRFGLGGEEEMTQKDVADKLGISQSYISRLEKRIIGKLKNEIEALV
jgi:RNA polymerase sporulation-specific sigma factor